MMTNSAISSGVAPRPKGEALANSGRKPAATAFLVAMPAGATELIDRKSVV